MTRRHRNKPVQRKVYAGMGGTGAGTIVAGFVIWLTGIAFGGSSAAGKVDTTVAMVPTPVSAMILFFVPIVLGGFAAWKAREDAVEPLDLHSRPEFRP